jgi:hypothetical protein
MKSLLIQGQLPSATSFVPVVTKVGSQPRHSFSSEPDQLQYDRGEGSSEVNSELRNLPTID